MLANLKRLVKWGSPKIKVSKNTQESSHIVAILKGFLEDILFWKQKWQSLSFIVILNLYFYFVIDKNINFIQLFLYLNIIFLIIDAFEAWLKYKHRTSCLKRLAEHDGTKINLAAYQFKYLMSKKCLEFMYLRESNHTKAFLLMNIVLGSLFLIGKYISGYLLCYTLCMVLCILYKIIPPMVRILKKVQQSADSDIEFEGLIPEVTDNDINVLSIEAEPIGIYDERQSLDYWKPDDLPLEEASDDSENSSSLATNLSMEKMHTFDKDVETSDSSEDEYIPVEQQKEHLQSTIEVIQPSATWGSSAYNTFWNLTGAVANLMYTKTEEKKRKRVSSVDSSDGFEIVDKRDII